MRTGRARTFHSSGLRCLTPLRCCADGSFIARAPFDRPGDARRAPRLRGHSRRCSLTGAIFSERSTRGLRHSPTHARRGDDAGALLSDAALGRRATAGRAPTPGRGGGTPVRTRASAASSSSSSTVWTTLSFSPRSSSTRRRPRWSTRARGTRSPTSASPPSSTPSPPPTSPRKRARASSSASTPSPPRRASGSWRCTPRTTSAGSTSSPRRARWTSPATRTSRPRRTTRLRGCGAAIALVDAVCDASEMQRKSPTRIESRARGIWTVPTARSPRDAQVRDGILPLRHGRVRGGARATRARDGSGDDLHSACTRDARPASDIFGDDPSVLFVSTHEDGNFPGTGKMSDAGEGDGVGATINVPLPPGSAAPAPRRPAQPRSSPGAARFSPDIVLVSAGYDAHWRDPLAGLSFRTGTYWRLSARLKALADELCGGRCVFLLEGGYDLTGFGRGRRGFVQGAARGRVGGGPGGNRGADGRADGEGAQGARRGQGDAPAVAVR